MPSRRLRAIAAWASSMSPCRVMAGSCSRFERSGRQRNSRRSSHTRSVPSPVNLPIDKVRTITEVLDTAIAQERLMSGIALVLAVVVIAIGCVGLYALMSYDVAQRTHELGVRLTLGATGGSVAILILRDAVKLVLPALMIGVPLGVIASRPLSSQLYDVTST